MWACNDASCFVEIVEIVIIDKFNIKSQNINILYINILAFVLIS